MQPVEVQFAIEADQNDAITLYVTATFGRGKVARYDMQSATIDSMCIVWEGGVITPIANIPDGDHYKIVHAKLADQGYDTFVYPIDRGRRMDRMRPLRDVIDMQADLDRQSRVDQSHEWQVDLQREQYAAPTFRSGSELLDGSRHMALT